MARPELAAWVRQARGVGLADDEMRQMLRQSGWEEGDIQNAIQHTREIPAVSEDSPATATRLLPLLGKAITTVFFLLECLLLTRIVLSYMAFTRDHAFARYVYYATDWITRPLNPFESYLIIDGHLAGIEGVALTDLQRIEGGMIDVPASAAFLAYLLVFTVISSLTRAVYKQVKRRFL